MPRLHCFTHARGTQNVHKGYVHKGFLYQQLSGVSCCSPFFWKSKCKRFAPTGSACTLRQPKKSTRFTLFSLLGLHSPFIQSSKLGLSPPHPSYILGLSTPHPPHRQDSSSPPIPSPAAPLALPTKVGQGCRGIRWQEASSTITNGEDSWEGQGAVARNDYKPETTIFSGIMPPSLPPRVLTPPPLFLSVSAPLLLREQGLCPKMVNR